MLGLLGHHQENRQGKRKRKDETLKIDMAGLRLYTFKFLCIFHLSEYNDT